MLMLSPHMVDRLHLAFARGRKCQPHFSEHTVAFSKLYEARFRVQGLRTEMHTPLLNTL